MDLLTDLPPLLRAFWLVAIPASLFLLAQIALLFAGADADIPDMDVGGAGGPLHLFTFRNLTNFLLGFSWSGIALYDVVPGNFLLVSSALVIGLSFVFAFFFITREIRALAEDNSFQLAHTLHKTAEVYLPIPARRHGKGKVLVSVNGTFHELDAMTEADDIPTGASVRIIRIENDHMLIVEHT